MRISNINKLLFVTILVFISGCSKPYFPEDPKSYIDSSDFFYNKAIVSYKKLIAQEKNPSSLYLKLGKIYFGHGDYDLAIDAFKSSLEPEARKFLALSYYRMGNFTDALEVFNREKMQDAEYLYYFGLTCERLNLFDQALKIYNQIKDSKFRLKAIKRIEEIEKHSELVSIKDVDSKIAGIINSVSSLNYPQAGALILLADEKIKITRANTQESSMHYLVKILNERGKEDFAEAAVEYDSTFEKIELVYARTIRPDGKVVNVGSRHIRDVTKYLNFPLYSNARVFIISFPEVAIGSVLEYKIKIKRSQLVNKKDFFLSYPVQSDEPIISSQFTLIIPKERKLNVKFINEEYNDFGARLNPSKEEAGEDLIYRWQFNSIPQIIPEPSMPHDAEINPAILLSTFNSWKDLYNWWWELAFDKIKPDSSIKETTKRIIKGKSSDVDRARAIYNFCAKDIRYVAVEYGQAGFEPHLAGDILRNKYGDCKDQAILLVTMLREAGLSAYPVLISTKQYYNLNKDFPSALFNHCIAVLYLKDKAIFLDPTAETCSFDDLPSGDQGRKVLVFKDEGYEIKDIPVYPAGHNLIKQELELKINKDESVWGNKINITTGIYGQAQRYWLLYTQPQLIQDRLKNVIQEISVGAKLVSYNIKNAEDLNTPVILSYSFSGLEYFTKAGNLRIMPQLASVDTSLVTKDSRKYPIDFGILNRREYLLEITIPEDFVLKYMPSNINMDNPWFSFIQEYSFKGNKITLRQVNQDKVDKISKEEYLSFKTLTEDLARSVKQRIVLEKLK
jgi:tetratricopeptide (TPR) repeat protein